MNFKRKWLAILDRTSGDTGNDEQQHQRALEDAIRSTMTRAAGSIEAGNDRDIIIKKEMERLMRSQPVTRLLSQYRENKGKLENLINERGEEAKADLLERRRYLRYRIYTAIGIAAVVLMTGYLAQRWNIPLPMLNRLPIQAP